MQRRDAALKIHAESGNHPRANEIRHLMKAATIVSVLILVAMSLAWAGTASAQDGHETDPAAALSAAFMAACRANETQFANYLTADNAAAFKNLPAEQRTAFLQRFSLSDQTGKPLISADAQ